MIDDDSRRLMMIGDGDFRSCLDVEVLFGNVFWWLAQKFIFEDLALALEVPGVTLPVFELQFSSP